MNIRALFSNINVFYVTILVILIVYVPFAWHGLTHEQHNWDDRFEKGIVDVDKCPHYSAYFGNYQATYGTYPFGLISAAVAGVITLLMFWVVTAVSPNMKLKDILPIIVAYSMLICFITGYKVINCSLGRLCGRGGWCLGNYPYTPGSPNSVSILD